MSERWTISKIRNRWLRGIAAWLVVIVSLPILLVMALIGSLVAALEAAALGFWSQVRMFFDEVVLGHWSMLSFRKP